LLTALNSIECGRDTGKPNIIIVLADDLGVNDVSWNNPAALTPYLARLAKRGVVLNNMYSLPICSPSRAALLTGVYPFRFGFQRGFGPIHPKGVPTSLPLLSQQLQANGYKNFALGKWHLGFCSDQYVPTNRGFNNFEGLYVGDEEDDIMESVKKRKIPKYDTEVYTEKAIKLIKDNTDQPFFIYLSLFTKAYPKELVSKQTLKELRLKKIQDMDFALKKLVRALKSTDQHRTTVLIFLSDNGAKYEDITKESDGYNFPLKGYKGTLYEGGTKIPGFIYSKLLSQSVVGTRFNGLMHMVDILPTVLNITGSKATPYTDGINQWQNINGKKGQQRNTMVYNVDDSFMSPIYYNSEKKGRKKFQIVVREKDMKLIWGQVNVVKKSSKEKEGKGLRFNKKLLELYDLVSDPKETTNLARSHPKIVKRLKEVGRMYYNQQQPEQFRDSNYFKKNEVLDAASPHGAPSNWCSPVQRTTCQVDKFVEEDYDLLNIFFGTLNSTQRVHCKTIFSKQQPY